MENKKTPERKPKVRIPPKRGQVKVKMFKELVKKVMSIVAPAKQGGGGGSSSTGSSASTTPPPTTYPSGSGGHSDA
ncbi:hypothetical protein PTKIN_Ptkin13bG0191100 [Pterospermum kingtungense]